MLPQVAIHPRHTLAVVAMLLLVGCTAAQSPAETPLSTPQPRPTRSGPTPSLPVARQAAPSPSPAADQTAPVANQTLQLRSSAFTAGGNLPVDFTCDGADQSPPLSWTGAPGGTTAFTLVEQDKDTVQKSTEPFTQWLVYNMPGRV